MMRVLCVFILLFFVCIQPVAMAEGRHHHRREGRIHRQAEVQSQVEALLSPSGASRNAAELYDGYEREMREVVKILQAIQESQAKEDVARQLVYLKASTRQLGFFVSEMELGRDQKFQRMRADSMKLTGKHPSKGGEASNGGDAPVEIRPKIPRSFMKMARSLGEITAVGESDWMLSKLKAIKLLSGIEARASGFQDGLRPQVKTGVIKLPKLGHGLDPYQKNGNK